MDEHRKHINEFLKEQREYMAFLEYGTPEVTPNAAKRAGALANLWPLRTALECLPFRRSGKRSSRLLARNRNESMYKGGSVFERRSERNPGVLGEYVS